MENLWDFMSTWSPFVQACAFVGAALILACVLYTIEMLARDLMGSWKMRKRAKRTKEVLEIVEDLVVDGLTEAIENKRVTLDEARVLYARIAHLGFWGLHPRKFAPKKSREDLFELKERLLAARSARENSKSKSIQTSKVMDKLMDGLEDELATL